MLKSIGLGTLLSGWSLALIAGLVVFLWLAIRKGWRWSMTNLEGIMNLPGTGNQAINQTQLGAIQAIMQRARQQGADCYTAELIAAQAAHETGNFTSSLYRNRNNAFGMKKGSIEDFEIRNPLDTSEYANYPDLESSVDDLFLWLYLKRLPLRGYRSAAEYAQRIKEKGYYEDSVSNYLTGMQRAIDNFESLALECGEVPILQG